MIEVGVGQKKHLTVEVGKTLEKNQRYVRKNKLY
jgi:hypothetical protein